MLKVTHWNIPGLKFEFKLTPEPEFSNCVVLSTLFISEILVGQNRIIITLIHIK